MKKRKHSFHKISIMSSCFVEWVQEACNNKENTSNMCIKLNSFQIMFVYIKLLWNFAPRVGHIATVSKTNFKGIGWLNGCSEKQHLAKVQLKVDLGWMVYSVMGSSFQETILLKKILTFNQNLMTKTLCCHSIFAHVITALNCCCGICKIFQWSLSLNLDENAVKPPFSQNCNWELVSVTLSCLAKGIHWRRGEIYIRKTAQKLELFLPTIFHWHFKLGDIAWGYHIMAVLSVLVALCEGIHQWITLTES